MPVPRWPITVIFVTFVLFLGVAWAQNEGSIRRDLRSSRAQTKILKRLLDDANRRETELAGKLADTRKRRLKAQDELGTTEGRLSKAQDELKVLQRRFHQTSLGLKGAQVALERRLKSIYMQGDISYMAVLLQSDDFTDFLNQSDYLQRILASDAELIASVKAKRTRLDTERDQVRHVVMELSELRRRKLDHLASLERLKVAQDDLDRRLEAHQAKLRTRIVAMEHISLKKEKELRELIRSRSRRLPRGVVMPRTAGAMIWPVQGPITSPFGYRIHPVTGSARFHSGLDIGVGYGVPVLAADNGVVLEAGWIGGYGNCVIIDHGGGWSSLYGHNSSLDVRTGQSVRQGQTIARVGSTGMSTGPHCHFEVRYQGNPIDPMSRL